jgi:hypothetical protein
MGNSKMKMMTMTCPRKGTNPPRKRRRTTSRPRRTRRQEVSCAPGCLTKMTTETTVGSPMTELMATMDPLVMMVPETMVVTAAATMMMLTLARFLQ